MSRHAPLIGIALVVVSACAGRSPAKYRTDTHSLLYARSTSLEACYKNALTKNAGANGTVTVHFVVEAKTGRIVRPTIDTKRTSAPQELMFCVLEAVDGLQLQPPDANEGHATFVYEFKRPPAES